MDSALAVRETAWQQPQGMFSPDMTLEQWKSAGWQLCRGVHRLNWLIGDWWVFGETQYGDRAAAAAEGIFELEFQTLMKLGTVSRAFETFRRRKELSWTHHAEVASLEPEIADALLDKAMRCGLSSRDMRREARAYRVTPHVGNESGAPIASRPDLIPTLRLVVDLATALSGYRQLTEAEASAVSAASSYLDSIGSWAAADLKFLKSLSHRRDWIEEAKAAFPSRSEQALRCIMHKVREGLGTSNSRAHGSNANAINGSRELLQALEAAGVGKWCV